VKQILPIRCFISRLDDLVDVAC